MTIARTLWACAALALAMPGLAAPGYPTTRNQTQPLGTCTATGRVQLDPPPVLPNQPRSYQVSGSTSAGAGSATVNIEGTMDGTSWDVLGTVTLTLGTTATSGGFRDASTYRAYALNCTALSGTGASVTGTAGY